MENFIKKFVYQLDRRLAEFLGTKYFLEKRLDEPESVENGLGEPRQVARATIRVKNSTQSETN